jgi:hypothetical protein
MASEYSGPPFAGIRECLTNLVTYGLTPQAVSDRGAVLMQLEIVLAEREPVPDDATEKEHEAADMAAVLSVLDKAVDKAHIPSSKDRRVLRHVLPIYEQYRGAPLKARRTAAGENIFDGDRVVAPSTIRTSYEPKALDWLGVILIKLEAEKRGEAPPTDVPRLQPD